MSARALRPRALMGAALALGAGTARAGAWSAGADASLEAFHDDNVRFTQSPRLVDQIGHAAADARMQWSDGASSLVFRPRIDGYWYRRYKTYDRTDGALAATGLWKRERAQLQLDVEGRIDTTLTSEFGWTGYSDANKRHESLSAALAPQWQLSERTTLLGNASWSRNRYIDAWLTPLVDYDYTSALLGLQRQLSERSSLALQASAGRIRVPGRPGYDKDSDQVVLDLRHRMGGRWSIELSAGPSRVHSPSLHADDNGVVYGATFVRTGERASLTIGAQRSVSPNGLGALTRRDLASLRGELPFSERASLSATASWSRINDSGLAGSFGSARLNYVDAGLAATWRPAPTWSVMLGAHRYLQSHGDSPTRAGRTQAQLRVSWSGLQGGAG